MEKVPQTFSGGGGGLWSDYRQRGIGCVLFVCLDPPAPSNPPLPTAEEKGRGAIPQIWPSPSFSRCTRDRCEFAVFRPHYTLT